MDKILVLNAGSSSLKFRLFATDGSKELWRSVKGQIDGIGTRPRLWAESADGGMLIDWYYPQRDVADVPAAIQKTAEWLRKSQHVNLVAVGHRVVHGGPQFHHPVLVDHEVLAQLERYVPLAPLHQPSNLASIRMMLEHEPKLPQVACFDTAFHRSQGTLADHYAIPEALYEAGVRRYGFHGLSYEYVAERL
jgi:acetate kinase